MVEGQGEVRDNGGGTGRGKEVGKLTLCKNGIHGNRTGCCQMDHTTQRCVKQLISTIQIFTTVMQFRIVLSAFSAK